MNRECYNIKCEFSILYKCNRLKRFCDKKLTLDEYLDIEEGK